MAVELNHTIVRTRDKQAGAAFLGRILGLPVGAQWGPFVPVQVGAVTFDYMDVDEEVSPQHYAFLVADDFRLVGPFGFVLDKEQWLDRYRSGDFSTSALAWTDVDVREYGDTAVAIGTYSQEAAYQGAPSNGEFRSTHVYVRDGGRWMIAGMQLSPTPSFSPPGAHAGA